MDEQGACRGVIAMCMEDGTLHRFRAAQVGFRSLGCVTQHNCLIPRRKAPSNEQPRRSRAACRRARCGCSHHAAGLSNRAVLSQLVACTGSGGSPGCCPRLLGPRSSLPADPLLLLRCPDNPGHRGVRARVLLGDLGAHVHGRRQRHGGARRHPTAGPGVCAVPPDRSAAPLLTKSPLLTESRGKTRFLEPGHSRVDRVEGTVG